MPDQPDGWPMLPPPPPGALGWNVYSGSGAGEYTWCTFVPAPDLDEKLATMAGELAEEITSAACDPGGED